MDALNVLCICFVFKLVHVTRSGTLDTLAKALQCGGNTRTGKHLQGK